MAGFFASGALELWTSEGRLAGISVAGWTLVTLLSGWGIGRAPLTIDVGLISVEGVGFWAGLAGPLSSLLSILALFATFSFLIFGFGGGKAVSIGAGAKVL
jgi:hypothetical protein